jgi:hypothetical protein
LLPSNACLQGPQVPVLPVHCLLQMLLDALGIGSAISFWQE